MPPRKSNVSITSNNAESQGPATPAGPAPGKEKEKKDRDKEEVAIEDLNMPRTMIQRLVKSVLPVNTQLQRDAVTALCKSATVFVSHVAGAASDHCAAANRRTINPNDVFAALKEVEHEAMVERLERELARWVDVNTNKRNEYRKKVKESKEGKDDAADEEANEVDVEQGAARDDSGDRAAKRMKGANGAMVTEGDEEDTMDVDEDEEAAGEDEDGEEDEDEEDEDAEDEDGEDEEDEDDEEDDDRDEEIDPAAAQLERESRAINVEESEGDSD